MLRCVKLSSIIARPRHPLRKNSMKSFRLLAALAPLFVSACGGGGGGGGGNFTLSSNALAFNASPFGALPEPIRVRMHLTDNKTIYIGAGYVDVPVPEWLSYSFETIDADDIDVVIWPHTTSLMEGTYTTVLTLGTADDDGDILKTREIDIGYTLDQVVDVIQDDVTYGFTFGHDDTQQVQAVGVMASAGDTYTASSDAAWLTVPDTVHTGTGYVYADIDVTGLAIGQHAGTVTVQNTEVPGESDEVTITVNIAAPQLSVGTASVLLGGIDGLDSAAAEIGFSLNTGTRAHPWTATLTDGGASWLLGDASGEVAGAGSALVVDADRAAVPGGTYTGSVKIDVDVDGHPLTATVPVTFNREAEKLVVTADGVAFVQLPSREMLARAVRVLSNTGRDDVAWTASSDQDWLEVTTSGETGDALTLAANPMLLAVDTLHVATVSIESDNPAVENTQAIRVGLWIGSADAGPVNLPNGILNLAMDPVAPLLYAHAGTDLISVYNVYTGALVTSYPPGTATPASMVVSSDGLRLYVAEAGSGIVNAINTADGLAFASYTTPFNTPATRLTYGRPDATPTLYFGGSGRIVDVATGAMAASILPGTIINTAEDNRRVFVDGARYEVRRSAVSGRNFAVTATGGPYVSGRDSAVSPDGTRYYASNGHPYVFQVFDGVTGAFIVDLPGSNYPNNAEVSWNGTFVGGLDAYYEYPDLWFYDAAGDALGTTRCFYNNNNNWLVQDSVRFSGDGMRYACVVNYLLGGGNRTVVADVPE
jgi:hypothetical protein